MQHETLGDDFSLGDTISDIEPESSNNEIYRNLDSKLESNFSQMSPQSDFPNIKRKKYAMYSSEIKQMCIDMSRIDNPRNVAKKFAVPLKSLKRWLDVGPERKKGGGRKIRDPEMETILFSWYTELRNVKNIAITAKMVKLKALEITKFSDFIASKGWLEKFKKKYKLELNRTAQNNMEI